MINKINITKFLTLFAIATSLVACSAISGHETAGEHIDDGTITTRVKASIINDLGLVRIGVESMKNVVQLSGFVDSSQIKVRAGDIARKISGVKAVQNGIVVR